MEQYSLYLGSYRVADPQRLAILARKPLVEVRLGVIGNAKDAQRKNDRAASLQAVYKDLGTIGLRNLEEVDLRRLYTADDVVNRLSDFDMIYVAGGSPSALMQAMYDSEFTIAIRELLRNGLVYCGESAGAIAAGSDILTEIWENLEEIRGVCSGGEPIRQGLGLIPRAVLPHADQERIAPHLGLLSSVYAHLLAIRDHQAYTYTVNRSTSHLAANGVPLLQ